MYSYTTAGPFGLEDMVRTSGPGMALIYQLIIPFFWCIPISLVAAELTTAMPVEGGFYRWTRAAFGDFWGFLAGWWNWCASFMLGALYAVLFTDYLSFYFPALTGWKHFAVAVLVIAVISYINVRGIRLVGRIVTVMELAILAVVLVMCLMSVRMWHHNPFSPAIPPHTPLFPVFGVGFALGLWLYAGYEQVSSVAEEVEDPQRSYPRALAWVVPLSMATYLLPTACALAAVWLVRDLRQAKVSRKSAFKLADVFYAAAWVLTVIQLIHGLRAKVNAIPFNEDPNLPAWMKRPKEGSIDRFVDTLVRNGVHVTVRRSKGRDIAAACGQLRGKSVANSRATRSR